MTVRTISDLFNAMSDNGLGDVEVEFRMYESINGYSLRLSDVENKGANISIKLDVTVVPMDKRKMMIDDLFVLTTRTKRALRSVGIVYVNQLTDMTIDELFSYKNGDTRLCIGRRGMQELVEKLAEHGLSFKKDEEKSDDR